MTPTPEASAERKRIAEETHQLNETIQDLSEKLTVAQNQQKAQRRINRLLCLALAVMLALGILVGVVTITQRHQNNTDDKRLACVSDWANKSNARTTRSIQERQQFDNANSARDIALNKIIVDAATKDQTLLDADYSDLVKAVQGAVEAKANLDKFNKANPVPPAPQFACK